MRREFPSQKDLGRLVKAAKKPNFWADVPYHMPTEPQYVVPSRREYHQMASEVLINAENELKEQAPNTLPSRFPAFLARPHVYPEYAERAVKNQERSLELQREAIGHGVNGRSLGDIKKIMNATVCAIGHATEAEHYIREANRSDAFYGSRDRRARSQG